ncbi:DUF6299 family protein [Streptomyces sp. NPDC046203]|uniref:DUF6299 family protein n=1 Tax=Streptomyces sp. NPDC046203 TaxID=3154602 RepID=UPI0033EB99C9
MRVRLALAAGVLATATTATALTGATATAAPESAPRGARAAAAAPARAAAAAPARAAALLTIDRRGAARKSGEVAVSGTYRCARGGSGPVFLATTLVRQDRSIGLGGTSAVCDGRTHRWTHHSFMAQQGATTAKASKASKTEKGKAAKVSKTAKAKAGKAKAAKGKASKTTKTTKARVEAVLVRLAPGGPMGLPMPVFLARRDQAVSLG